MKGLTKIEVQGVCVCVKTCSNIKVGQFMWKMDEVSIRWMFVTSDVCAVCESWVNLCALIWIIVHVWSRWTVWKH